MLADARETLAAERRHALAEARRAALDLAGEIATRLLAAIPIKLRAEGSIERIQEYLAGLPNPETDALKRQLIEGVPLKVVTASALSAETEGIWRTRLGEALCGRVTVDFGVDPALIGGVELYFPSTVLRFSWQSTLAAIREGIETDADAH